MNHLSARQLNRAFLRALDAVEFNKHVTLHGLRHAFATHLLEQREDIRVIQVLLGHQKLDNTSRYTHVATTILHEVKGPLEYLDMNTPPAQAGGFGLRLKAGSVGRSADCPLPQSLGEGKGEG